MTAMTMAMTVQAQPSVGNAFQVYSVTYVVTKATVPYEAQVQGFNGLNYPNRSITLNNLTIPATVYDGTDNFIVAGIQDKAFYPNLGLTGTLTLNHSGFIGDSAFVGANNIASVNIAAGVTDIGIRAFSGANFTALTLNNSGNIGSYAFYQCANLAGALTIPATVTGIGNGAFYSCVGLTSVVLDNCTDSIGDDAFNGCTGLTGALDVPSTVTNIGESAFYATSLTSLTLNNSGYIGESAFANTLLADTVIIPATVTGVGIRAFLNCNLITSLILADDYVGNIGDEAFHNCSGLLDTLVIPGGVTDIGVSAFNGCSSLTAIDFTDFVADSICAWAFNDCSSVVCLTFGSAAAPRIGVNTFADVAAAGKLSCPVGADYSAIRSALPTGWITNGSDFTAGSGITYVITDIVAAKVKVKGGSLNPNQMLVMANPVIPQTVTVLGEAYDVTGIEAYAFSQNTNLSGTLDIQCNNIGDYAFYGCTGLGGLLALQSDSIGSNAFNSCTGFDALTFANTCESIGSSAFSGCTGLDGTLTIPFSVTNTGSWAFNSCTGLDTVILQNGGGLGSGLFNGCIGLTSVDFSAFSGSIGHSAFYGCSALADTLVIPPSVTSIGDHAFYVTALRGLVLQSNGDVGELAFAGLVDMDYLVLECSGNIGKSAFEYSVGLRDTLVIPAGVTGIGVLAFGRCDHLTSVDFTAYTGSSIEANAFRDDSCITSLTFAAAVAPTVAVNTFTGLAPVGYLYYPSNATGYDVMLSKLPPGWRLSFTGVPFVGTTLTDDQGIVYIVTRADIPYEVEVLGGIGNPNNSVAVNNPVIPDTVITSGGNKYAVKGIQDDAFRGNTSLTGTLAIHSADSIGQWAFRSCSALSGALVIPASITGVGNYAFDDCSGFTSLTLNNSGNIGHYAFENCVSLSGALVIPEDVGDVGHYAFFGCRLITSLALNNTGMIGHYAFENCTGLGGALVIPASITDVGNSAFRGAAVTSLDVRNSGSIGYYAFAENNSLVSADFSEYAEDGNIGDFVFHDCSALNLLTFGSMTAPAVSSSAFTGVADVGTLIYYDGAAGYDVLYSYLPVGWTVSLIVGNTAVGGSALEVHSTAGGLRVTGLVGDEVLTLYNLQGGTVYTGKAISDDQIIPLSRHGVYILIAGRRVAKAVYHN